MNPFVDDEASASGSNQENLFFTDSKGPSDIEFINDNDNDNDNEMDIREMSTKRKRSKKSTPTLPTNKRRRLNRIPSTAPSSTIQSPLSRGSPVRTPLGTLNITNNIQRNENNLSNTVLEDILPDENTIGKPRTNKTDKTGKPKEFQIRNRYVFLTYPQCDITTEMVISALFATKYPPERYFGCKEIHEKTGGYHFHVLVDLGVDAKGNAPHIRGKKAERIWDIKVVCTVNKMLICN